MAEIKKYLDLAVGLPKLVDEIKAADAKVLADAKKYAEDLGANYDAAGAAGTAEENAKAHADAKVKELADGAVKTNADEIAAIKGDYLKAADKTELQGKIDAVDGKADENAAAIEAINAADTGILAQAKADAKSKADAVQANVDALAGKVGEVPEGSTVMGIIANIQENAYDDTEIRGLIDGLEENKADKEQVAKDIAAAVKVEEEARIAAVSGVQGAVDALAGTHATDKKALEDAIALKADKTALDAVSAVANAAATKEEFDAAVEALEAEDARIAELVAAEAERAAGVEAGIEERLVEVETFFKTAEGETIDEALDTLVELQTYLNGEGAVADQMLLDIAANKKAIEDHVATNHDFAAADTALKAELNAEIDKKANTTVVEAIDDRLEIAEGKVETLESEMDTVEGKVSTLEGEMDAVEAAVATKVEQEAYNTKIAALEGADAGQVERIAALEAKFNGEEGSVSDMIADAKQEAIDTAADDATSKANKALEDAKKYADDEDAKIESRVDALETASATHALASDVTALAGRVTTAEGEIDTLQSEMDAVEALAAAADAAAKANASAIALKASQADLDAAVARIGANETAIAEKAAASDLAALAERVTTNEALSADNKARLDAFVAISADEISALFA